MGRYEQAVADDDARERDNDASKANGEFDQVGEQRWF